MARPNIDPIIARLKSIADKGREKLKRGPGLRGLPTANQIKALKQAVNDLANVHRAALRLAAAKDKKSAINVDTLKIDARQTAPGSFLMDREQEELAKNPSRFRKEGSDYF